MLLLSYRFFKNLLMYFLSDITKEFGVIAVLVILEL